tara:strand:- start:242 stop:481 length:240 start_codon:yes stop_codon:yes gene_type:complete
LVERNLAKVEVAGSNPVFRSKDRKTSLFTKGCRSGGIGRHAGLKIQWAVMLVRVQVPPSVLQAKAKSKDLAFLFSRIEN